MKRYRVLFIAMSGVRVQNKKLLDAGLTLPGFVERSRVIASLPSLGLLTLAAHTPTHWDVEYLEIDELNFDCFPVDYDVVAISSLTARILDAYKLADYLRRQGVTVVIGGLHATVLPLEAQQHADAIIQGEGETLWPQLLYDYENNQLRSFYSSLQNPEGRHKLRNARVPRYDLLDISQYNRLTLQTTRGCPLDCAFCGASRLISSYQIKPIEHVRREIEAILEIWPKPFLELADDNTFFNKRWARELVALLGEYDISWFTETDISVADDEQLLSLLAQSGCAQLLIGLESTDAAALQNIDSRQWKYSQRASFQDKIAKIQSYGIAVNGCFILGFDSDDAGVFERTRDFIFESELSDVQITLLTPFPGTALYHQLKNQQRLLRPVYWEQCTLFDVTFQPKQMSTHQLETGFQQLMAEVYSPAATSQRKMHFRDCVRRRKRKLQN